MTEQNKNAMKIYSILYISTFISQLIYQVENDTLVLMSQAYPMQHSGLSRRKNEIEHYTFQFFY
jgi:hypothetical protein